MNLDFDDSIRMHPRVRKQERDKIRRNFISLVDNKLALHKDASIKRFSIKCKNDVGPAHVVCWITNVLKRRVKELVLDMSWISDWPLSSEVVVSERMVQEFWKSCSISSRSLERLTFRFHEMFDENHESVSFDTPNLVYLEYSDVIADTYPNVNLGSLVEASLDLRMTREQIHKAKFSSDDLFKPEEGMVGNATDFITGIRNVKTLYLTDNFLEVLAFCCEPIPVFDSLIQLTVKSDRDVEWESLTALLKNSPNLETLVLEGILHRIGLDCKSDDCMCKTWEEEGIPTCLSSSPVKMLKIFNFGEGYEYDDMDNEMEQVMFFLEKMPNLQQLIVHYGTSIEQDAEEVFRQFQMVSREGLAKCKIQVISDKLILSST